MVLENSYNDPAYLKAFVAIVSMHNEMNNV